ncbi:amidase domain-containing protein [Actinosynnema sp. CA-299493]
MWTFNSNGLGDSFSRIWSRAHDLREFATERTDRAWVAERAPAADAAQIWNLLIADLLFIDWQSDGGIDHVVIVVDFYSDPPSVLRQEFDQDMRRGGRGSRPRP